jgi:hypothetical protein
MFLFEHPWTHTAQILWYSNIANIICSTLNPTFSSVQNSLFVICWFAQMSWVRRSSFHELAAVRGHPERGLLSHYCCHCWNAPPTSSLCSHPLFGLCKHSASVDECQLVQFFLHGGIKWHISALGDAIQTAPLLLLSLKTKTKLNSVALVREWTIPTEWPPLVGEVSANSCR